LSERGLFLNHGITFGVVDRRKVGSDASRSTLFHTVSTEPQP
jgi:hypothetical protein